MRGRGGTPELDGHSLLGTARLLTGSPGAGADLLVRVLARRPATREAALARLVRALRGRRSGLGRGAGSIDAEVPTDAWWVSPADVSAARATEAALDRLTLDQRTVLVLTHAEQLDPGAVGRLVPGAAGLLRSAEAQVVAEVPDPADLPARLDGVLALDGSPDDADLLLPLRVRAARRSRRLRWATASGVAAALVVGSVLVPGDGSPTEPPAAAPSTATATPAEETSVSEDSTVVVDVQTGEGLEPVQVDLDATFGPVPAGSLADDPVVLAALLDRATAYVPPTAQVSTARVLFAGNLAGLRVGVVVSTDPFGLSYSVFWGGADTPVPELDSAMFVAVGSATSTSVVVGEPAVMLTLVRPGDTVESSPGVRIGTDGVPTRDWDSAVADDGAVVTPLPAGLGGTPAYRVVREGVAVDGDPVFDLRRWTQGDGAPRPPGPPAPSRPGAPSADPGAWQAAVEELVRGTGSSTAELAPQVLWAGTMPVRGDRRAEFVVVTAVLPNGAVLASTGYSYGWEPAVGGMSGDGQYGSCGTTGHPAGTDPSGLVVAALCSVFPGDVDDVVSALVVTAPAGTGTVTLGAGDGGPDVPIRLSRGWAVVREPDAGLTTVTAPTPGRVSAAGAGDLWDV